MDAYVLINIRTGEIRDVVRQIRRVEGVTEANMTFGPFDAVVAIKAEDVNHIGRILTNGIQPIPGIVETLTCLAVDLD
jgi:DNA-binding Lrp family transcriptional regulator